MTRFTKENLKAERGGYVVYAPNGRDFDAANRVVARFKHGRGGGRSSFMTHLRKRWSVEDYFAAREAGETPRKIAESTGWFYVPAHIKKALKEGGYPVNRAGYAAYLVDSDIVSEKYAQKIS